ncbi:MAG: acyltransferase [Actinobacteria bacterium]|nr:acyltransferase [Actinomycetota bacterium]
MIESTSPRLAGLDGLRGWAVIAVVAFHTGLLRAGWVGVDVFMALSGFLITGVIVRELDASNGLRLRRFWGRRARRLAPALLVLIGLVALVSAIAPDGWTAPTPREVWGAFTYSSNWLRLGVERSYWQMFDAPSPFDHLWSLAVEEQFYVVWPIMMVVAWRLWGRRGTMIVGTILAIMASASQVWLSLAPVSIERIYVGTDTRAPAFLFGALANLMISRLPLAKVRIRFTLAFLIAAALVVASVVFDGDARWTYRGPLLVASLCGAGLVGLVASLHEYGWASPLLAGRSIRALGRWSYGIYLFHWPIVLLIGIDRGSSWLRFSATMVVATLLASFSHRVLERPILEHGVSRRFVPFAMVAVGAVVVGSAITSSEPIPEMSDRDIQVMTSPLPQPTIPATPGPPPERVLVVGDSAVFGLRGALVDVGRSMDMDVEVRAAPGCTTSRLREDQNNLFSLDLCAAIRVGLTDDVERFRPDRIILFYAGTWDPFVWSGERLSPCSSDGGARIRQGMEELLTDLGRTSRIQLVIPPQMSEAYAPETPGVAACYAREYLSIEGIDFIRLDEFVCPVDVDRCADEVGGVRLRHDGLHFSPEGIEIVTPMILSGVEESQ